jgi:hypothetical protein
VRGQAARKSKVQPGLLFRERRSVQQGGEERARNRRRRRIVVNKLPKKIQAAMPKPRFSPKMKHDSCHYQYPIRGVRMATNVRLMTPVSVSRSSAVHRKQFSALLGPAKLHLSPLRVRRRGTDTRGKPRVVPARGGTAGERSTSAGLGRTRKVRFLR